MIKYKKIKGGYWKPILPHSIASGEKYYANFGEVVIHGEPVSVWRGEVLLQWNSTRLIRCPKYYVLVLEDDKTFVIDDEKKGDDACDYIEALSIASKRNYPIYLIKRREALKSFRHIRDRVNLPRGAKIVLFDVYQGLKMKKDLTKASFEKKKDCIPYYKFESLLFDNVGVWYHNDWYSFRIKNDVNDTIKDINGVMAILSDFIKKGIKIGE